MSFDIIAPHYRWLESVTAGSLLQRCRTAFIGELRSARGILLLGEGRGRFLIELLRVNQEAQITCLDASARMLELTQIELRSRGISTDRFTSSSSALTSGPRSSLGSLVTAGEDENEGGGRNLSLENLTTDRVRFVHADILNGSWGGDSECYDAVASHFFLDCFRPDQLEQIASTVAACTGQGARWLISDFCIPEQGWRRLRARMIVAAMYAFFRRVTRLPATRLTPPDTCLKLLGFQLQDRRHYNHGLIHSDLWIKMRPMDTGFRSGCLLPRPVERAPFAEIKTDTPRITTQDDG